MYIVYIYQGDKFMGNVHEFHWAKLLSRYAFDSEHDGRWGYMACCGIIRQACHGAFDVCLTARCRRDESKMAVCQKRDLPWIYLFECMRISDKDFYLFLPRTAPCGSVPFDPDFKRQCVYAWYDEASDGIEVLAYTGKWREEEITYPEYDGYGRFDYEDQVVSGTIGRNGKWISKPELRWV